MKFSLLCKRPEAPRSLFTPGGPAHCTPHHPGDPLRSRGGALRLSPGSPRAASPLAPPAPQPPPAPGRPRSPAANGRGGAGTAQGAGAGPRPSPPSGQHRPGCRHGGNRLISFVVWGSVAEKCPATTESWPWRLSPGWGEPGVALHMWRRLGAAVRWHFAKPVLPIKYGNLGEIQHKELEPLYFVFCHLGEMYWIPLNRPPAQPDSCASKHIKASPLSPSLYHPNSIKNHRRVEVGRNLR